MLLLRLLCISLLLSPVFMEPQRNSRFGIRRQRKGGRRTYIVRCCGLRSCSPSRRMRPPTVNYSDYEGEISGDTTMQDLTDLITDVIEIETTLVVPTTTKATTKTTTKAIIKATTKATTVTTTTKPTTTTKATTTTIATTLATTTTTMATTTTTPATTTMVVTTTVSSAGVVTCNDPTCTIDKTKVLADGSVKVPMSQGIGQSICGGYYFFSQIAKTHSEAAVECCKLGLKLVSVLSNSEADCLANLNKMFVGDVAESWSSASDEGAEGKWTWCAINQPISTGIKWGASEPDNVGNDENCGMVRMSIDSPPVVTLHDKPCSAIYKYVCKSLEEHVEEKELKFEEITKADYVVIGDHEYYFSPDGIVAGMEECKIKCHNLGMKLISLQTKEKNELIKNYLIDIGQGVKARWSCGQTVDGIYQWTETGEDFTYTDWFSDYDDDNIAPYASSCVSFSGNKGWFEFLCTTMLPFICE